MFLLFFLFFDSSLPLLNCMDGMDESDIQGLCVLVLCFFLFIFR